jgi:hypothetical protein
MPLARALLLLSLLLLAGCDLAPLPPGRAYPVLLPLDQILLAPVGTRAPDPGLLARGAALRARAAALGAL